MVLRRSNFEIPARFSFRPFSARWIRCDAELVEWYEKPEPLGGFPPLPVKPIAPFATEREKVLVRIEVPDDSTSGMLAAMGLGPCPSHTVELFRDNVPSDVLRPHENRRKTPDISGREFAVLVCKRREFESFLPSGWKPGDVEKNAWAMRAEFFDLDEDDWEWNLQLFLNRWGLWNYGAGFQVGFGERMPGFALVLPHLLKEKREQYRKALALKSARAWLSTKQPLSISTMDRPPYFRVERFFCEDAIQATITIDHLAGRQFSFCKRCRRLFEHETLHKKNYCSRQCIQAAGVKRWRSKQKKKATTKGANRNAKG
jgi:hypothetical protein